VPFQAAKQQLEIQSLKRGFQRAAAITGITALISLVVATGGWLFDRQKTRDAHRDDLFAKALDNFANDSAVRRITGVTSLAQLQADRSEEVIQALTNRILTEEDGSVLEQIAWALGRMGPAALRPCTAANRKAASAFVSECGRFAAGDPKHFEKALLDINKLALGYFGPFQLTPRWAGPLDVLLRSGGPYRSGLEVARVRGVFDASKGLIAIEKKWNQLVATSASLEYLLKSLPHPAAATELSDIVLIGVDLRKLNLSGANLSRATLSGRADNADLTCSDLSDANLSLAWLEGAKLKSSDVTRARFESPTSTPALVVSLTGTNWWDALESVADGTSEIQERASSKLRLPGRDIARERAYWEAERKACLSASAATK
jgi:Pentapeptide repeats (8 copies)